MVRKANPENKARLEKIDALIKGKSERVTGRNGKPMIRAVVGKFSVPSGFDGVYLQADTRTGELVYVRAAPLSATEKESNKKARAARNAGRVKDKLAAKEANRAARLTTQKEIDGKLATRVAELKKLRANARTGITEGKDVGSITAKISGLVTEVETLRAARPTVRKLKVSKA